MTDAVAYALAVSEMLETLEYLKREFERNGRIDVINMAHVNKAIELAKPQLTKRR